MEKIKGIVKGINYKEDKNSFGLTFDGSNWFNGFGKPDCKKGDEIELEYKINGNWKNVASIKVLNSGKEESNFNFKSMAISYAKDLAVAGIIKVDEIAEKAKGFIEMYNQL